MRHLGRVIWVVLAAAFAVSSCSSDPPQASEGAPPEIGTVTEGAIKLDLECRNVGTVEAFGFEWLMVEVAPLEWSEIESLNGEIRFESLERSTFATEGETVDVSNTMVVGDECVRWP